MTKQEIKNTFTTMNLTEADALIAELRTALKERRPLEKESAKINLAKEREKLEKINKAQIKVGNKIYTTYKKGKPAIGIVTKTGENTLTVDFVDENDNQIIAENGKPAKTWKRYWQVSLTAPVIEETSEEEDIKDEENIED